MFKSATKFYSVVARFPILLYGGIVINDFCYKRNPWGSVHLYNGSSSIGDQSKAKVTGGPKSLLQYKIKCKVIEENTML